MGQGLARRTHKRICRMAPNLPKMSYISSVVMLKGRFLQPWYNTLPSMVVRCPKQPAPLRMAQLQPQLQPPSASHYQ